MQPHHRRCFLRVCGATVLIAAAPVLPAHAAADVAGLIQALTGSLGVTPTQAQGGAGALFGLAQQRMPRNEFSQIEQSVPGIGSLIAQAPAAPQAGAGRRQGDLGSLAAGALGALGGEAGGGLGGSLGALAPLAGTFTQLGISPEVAAQFLPVVLEYLSGNGAGSAAGLLQGALAR